MDGAAILAKFFREQGFNATVRGMCVSVKINGIRRSLPVEHGHKIILCNQCYVSLYSPDSLELIHKAALGCEGVNCEECEAYKRCQEKEEKD